MLYPMIESSLPESILIAWQRSTRDGSQEEPPKSRLSLLMEFLGKEVENEQRISIAQAGFDASPKHKNKPAKVVKEGDSLATAAGLLSSDAKQAKCVFCNMAHESQECKKAQNMTLEEKKSTLRSKKCCFICLRQNHMARKCRSYIKCHVCSKRHYTLMCPELPHHKDKGTDGSNFLANEDRQAPQQTLSNQTCTSDVLLQTLMVRVVGKGQERLVRAIIDSGSQRSYILERTAVCLGLKPISKESINHSLFGGTHITQQHHKYKIKVEHKTDTYSCTFDVLDQGKICGAIPRTNKGPWLEELRSAGICLSDFGSTCPEIEILIGADVYGRLLTGRIFQLSTGLTAVETLLGWTLMGINPCDNKKENCSSLLVMSMFVENASITDLWSLETIGIRDPVEMKSKKEIEEAAKQHFLATVSRETNGRYQVSLPWVDENRDIPSNRTIAEQRLSATTKKLMMTGRLVEYESVLNEWIEEGIVEEVPKEEMKRPCHYLPHRPVFKDNSLSTKVRPVFDASAKGSRSPSLNECLSKGPNLIEKIPSILLRFRENKIGVTADIRKAFLMISVEPKDRDFLRFLWWLNFDENEFKEFRHKRVVFGLNCSPYLLSAVIECHLSKVPTTMKKCAEKLLNSLYVDNCVTSVCSTEELEHFKRQSTEIMADAQMDLRMWENSLLQPKESENQLTSVLGLKWNKATDTLSCVVPNVELNAKMTKRSVLSAVQKIFDPLGFLSPVTITPKTFLQQTWANKMSWDEELPEDIKKRFADWLQEICVLEKIQIPRRVTRGSKQAWSLHIFCDASKFAYAAVVFIRCETEKTAECQMLLSKARVAPLKATSIPRLELLACTIGGRLANSVRQAFTLEGVPEYYWSDSTTALTWIKRNDKWGTFVGNRVREICSLTKPEDWRYVPSEMNPADLPSRGCGSTRLLESRWWEGPPWLQTAENNWPVNQYSTDEVTICSEKRKTIVTSTLVSTNAFPLKIFDGTKFSRAVRIVSWILRFISNTRKSTQHRLLGDLNAQEIDNAELVLLKMVQTVAFSNKNFPSGLQVKFDDKGVLRVQTKILMRDDTENFRFPVLLPAKHPLVNSLISEVHENSCHAGLQYLMAKLREKYWIVNSRRVIRSVLHKCVTCRRYDSTSPTTAPAPLPEERVKDAGVFEIIGIDLAGPLYLKDRSKTWIVLITCAVYRAVHLELVSSISTECFLQAFRRFVARRGRPKVIFSDRGTNFIATENLFRQIDWTTIYTQFATARICWRFSPPTAAWWGGWWERLVRTLKGLLCRVLGKSVLNFEELQTVLCDAEAVMNGRPMTYISDCQGDLMPLTPSMFVQEIKEVGVPDVDVIERTGLLRRYRYRQRLRDDFRKRFRNEYLGQLVQKAKDNKQHRQLKVGEVVLVGADNKKRLHWPMARVVKLIPGRDGCVRVATVKTSKGLFTRPVRRLYPLEVTDDEISSLSVKPCVGDRKEKERSDDDQLRVLEEK